MPRQKNTRPTNVYWLYDMRPEMVAVFGPKGVPFYCGKTVGPISRRLIQHKSHVRRSSNCELSKALVLRGNYVRVELIEIVPLGDDWAARERYWIAFGRAFYPYMANTKDGGTCGGGYVPSAETRAKLSAANKGRKLSAEVSAKMSVSQKGKVFSAEHRAKLSAAATRRAPITAAANRRRVWSKESRAKSRATMLRRHAEGTCASF